MTMGDEADAMWEREIGDQGYDDAAKAMRVERPAKTRCPTCGKLFKCVEAHHLVKHHRFLGE